MTARKYQMSQKIGLSNIITHLHREPGIDREVHPELFQAAYDARRLLRDHFIIEGLDLLIDSYLGVMSVVLADQEKLDRLAEAENIEPFRPIYASRAEDHWSSAILTMLRMRFESAIANPMAAWVSEDELFNEYLDYHDAEHRENSAKVRTHMVKKLNELANRHFVDIQAPKGRARHYAITKWAVLRLTDDKVRTLTETLTEWKESRQSRGQGPQSDTNAGPEGIHYEMFEAAKRASAVIAETNADEFLSEFADA